ncbi:MAG: ester cyclase [Actinomycetota bacterium]
MSAVGEDLSARARAQLAMNVTPRSYEAVRRLWITHAKAELTRDIEGLIATLTPDCVYELVGTGERWEGHEGARAFYGGFFEAFPDSDIRATDLVIGPQGVSLVAEMRATHLGRWRGAEPTGKPIHLQFIVHFPWDEATERFTGERIWFAR